MTKREICERLIDLRDNMIHGQDSANSMGELSYVLSVTGKLIRGLLLDLAAPEEHFADVGKMVREEEEPPVLLYEERDEKVPCPVCGEPAYIIKNAPKIYCKRCAKTYPRVEV